MASDKVSRKRKSDESIKDTKKRPKLTFGGTVEVNAGPQDARRTFVVHEDLLLQRSRWLAHLCERAKSGLAIRIPSHHDAAVVEAYYNWLYHRNLDLSVVEDLGETSSMIEDQNGQGSMHDVTHLTMFRRITGLAKMYFLGDILEDREFCNYIMDTLSDCNMEKHCGILHDLAGRLIKMKFRLSSNDPLAPPILWTADVMSVALTSEQLIAVLRDDELGRDFVEALVESLARLRNIATAEHDFEAFKTANRTRYHI